jgi:lipopolysaccharide export system permease protein
MALQALPLALLFGVLFTVHALHRSGELLALRGAGAGPFRLALPAMAVAAVLSVVAFWAADGPVPRLERTVTHIQVRVLQRWTYTWTIFHLRPHWYAGQGHTLYHVGHIDDGGHRLEDVTRYDATGGRFTRLATADTLTFADGRWHAEGVRVWRFPADPRRVALTQGPMRVELAPAIFAGLPGEPRELTGAELDQAIRLRRHQGRPVAAMTVERQSRRALPLLGLALATLALGLALRLHVPRTVVETAGTGVAIAFAGWTLLALGRALGLSGLLAPWLAAWIPVALPAALGLALLLLDA